MKHFSLLNVIFNCDLFTPHQAENLFFLCLFLLSSINIEHFLMTFFSLLCNISVAYSPKINENYYLYVLISPVGKFLKF